MTDELYNYIILSIVVLAYLHLWFHKFKYQKYEQLIENKINERFEKFINEKIDNMKSLINNYDNHLNTITETKIYEIENTHEKFEESSKKILNNINNFGNELSKLEICQKKIAGAVNEVYINSLGEIQTKNDLIVQKNDHIKRLEAMIEQRNKKIKRLENGKNN